MNPSYIRVESDKNERFRQLEALCASSRERRKRQRSVIEGIKTMQAFQQLASSHEAQVHDVFVSEASLQNPQILALLDNHPGAVLVLSAPLFKRASQMANSPGPVAIIDTPRPNVPELICGELVYLDRVQDPGNMGTILRTCAAAGVTQVFTSRGTAFCWAPKVLRAAMGAHFALQIYEGVEPAVLFDRLAGDLICRAVVAPGAAAAASDLHHTDLTGASAWLFGSEGEGLRAELLRAKVQRVTISQQPAVESMNVAAAVAVCLFEARRQRDQFHPG